MGCEVFYQRHFLLNKGRRQDNEEVGLMGEGRAYLVFICKVIGNSLSQFLVEVTATLGGESISPHFSGEETDTCSCFLRAKLGEAGIELQASCSDKEPGKEGSVGLRPRCGQGSECQGCRCPW